MQLATLSVVIRLSGSLIYFGSGPPLNALTNPIQRGSILLLDIKIQEQLTVRNASEKSIHPGVGVTGYQLTKMK